MTTSPDLPMTSKVLLERLRRHYIKPGEALPGGVFLPEVGWNGRGGSRRTDALYAGFTTTSGRILIGHELKVSRSDWRAELAKNGKADEWADECHAWYVVAPSTDVVPAEEVPNGWGLMVVNPRSKTRLQVVIRATVKADHAPSWDALRSVLARADTLRAQTIADVRGDADKKAYERVRADQERRNRERAVGETLTDGQARRLKALDRLEESLGVKVSEWSWDDDEGVSADVLGSALRLVKAGRQANIPDYAVRQIEGAVAALNEANEAASEWRALVSR